MSPEVHSLILGVIVPTSFAIGALVGWHQRRLFDEKLERHKVSLKRWNEDLGSGIGDQGSPQAYEQVS